MAATQPPDLVQASGGTTGRHGADHLGAQQTYAMGLQKLTGMFGANPCPAVKPPQ